MRRKIIVAVIAISLLLEFNLKAIDGEPKFLWPIEIESDGGYVTTLYQPQLESFNSNIMEGRMAVTIKPDKGDLVFGAVWFNARIHTDLDKRTVLLQKMDIVKTHFPDMVDEEKTEKFSKLLSAEIESWDLEMSLDRILASLSEVENLKELSDRINNDPPNIYFKTSPAVLVVIDGEPIVKEDNDLGLDYVVNTQFFIVKENNTNKYFLNGGSFWYASDDILKGWKETTSVPSKIIDFAKENQTSTEADSIVQTYSEAPELIVETGKGELILVDGEIEYQAIKETSLLYVKNSETDIIMDINSQKHYILIAGRWYASASLKDGDWKFIEPNDLPSDFAKIPEDSDMTSVRPSVPGTAEAQTALLEHSIPQTAVVDRNSAKLEVKYDGEPKFESITGTSVAYAVNTDMQVLLIDNRYYCVDDGIWFVSGKAKGPWEVSTERPDEVDNLPPESPVYNTKYVYIYDVTPEVVYVGYLPGYTHCYVYGGVVVYGTGYYYHPWYRYHYYPRPVTWGFGVHYNPWTGWGFSVGVSYGWVSWRYHPYHHAYWGPRGYHHGYRHGYHHGYRRGYHHGYRAGYTAGNKQAYNNVYRNRDTGVRHTRNVSNRPNQTVNSRARTSNKSNNMYTDRSGNVYQRNKSGNYENRTNRSSRPSTQQPSANQRSRQQLDHSHQNRQQGTQNYNRSQQYNHSGTRPGGSSTRPSGGAVRRR